MTRKTYCGNILWQSGLTLLALADGFATLAAPPEVMFTATDAVPGANNVTDGPYFLRSRKSRALHMIWSNWVDNSRYCILQRTSPSGRLAGPWSKDRMLFDRDGGHGMIFEDFDGHLLLTLHQPSGNPDERMRIMEVTESKDGLECVETHRSGVTFNSAVTSRIAAKATTDPFAGKGGRGTASPPCNLDFKCAWRGRSVFDAEMPFPDGVSFVPSAHYRAGAMRGVNPPR